MYLAPLVRFFYKISSKENRMPKAIYKACMARVKIMCQTPQYVTRGAWCLPFELCMIMRLGMASRMFGGCSVAKPSSGDNGTIARLVTASGDPHM